MATTDTRRPALDPTPLFAVVGATDLAVERVRAAVANASAAQAQLEKAVNEFDSRKAQETAKEIPTLAVARVLEAASKAEKEYETLAVRGKKLVDRIRTQQSTQDLIAQGKVTISRGKAVLTTARKAADDTATAIRGTLVTGRRGAQDVADSATTSSESAVKSTRSAAKKTGETARKGAASTSTRAKAARTTAAKTASAASEAAKDAAEKVGD